MTDELTERLRTALVKAGYTDSRNGNPSVRAMTRDLGLNNSRVSRYLYHGSNMQLAAREQIAEALGMTVSELDSEVEGVEVATYSPPAAANKLNERERSLVNELINILAERNEQGEKVMGNAEHPTPIVDEAGATDDTTVHEADFGAPDDEEPERDTEYYERRYGKVAHRPDKGVAHDAPLDEQ